MTRPRQGGQGGQGRQGDSILRVPRSKFLLLTTGDRCIIFRYTHAN
jgi:hypothetical protein